MIDFLHAFVADQLDNNIAAENSRDPEVGDTTYEIGNVGVDNGPFAVDGKR